MEHFLQAIFGNAFLVIAIIAGIANRLNQNKKRQQNKPRKVPTRSTTQQQTTSHTTESSSSYRSTRELAEMRRQKMREMQTSLSTTKPIMREEPEKFVETHTEKSHNALPDHPVRNTHIKGVTKKPKISIKNQLSKKQVIENIIMSEVLGPPRAKKGYRSSLQQNKD